MIRKPLEKIKNKNLKTRTRRKLHIRKTLAGTTDRPRVCIVKSNKHLLVQVVDDSSHKTLFTLSSFGKSAPEGAKKTLEGAKILGTSIGRKLSSLNIKTVVFDRNGFQYVGMVSTLADSIRAEGIQF